MSTEINTSQVRDNLDAVPEIFKRHIGTWKGEYIKVSVRGRFQKSFLGTFSIAIAGSKYRQVNVYEYEDGSRTTLNFEGEFEGGILRLASSSYYDFSAIAWDAGQETIGFRVTKTEDGVVITFMETITLLDPSHRVRSTQAYRDGVFDGISFIEEVRV